MWSTIRLRITETKRARSRGVRPYASAKSRSLRARSGKRQPSVRESLSENSGTQVHAEYATS